MRIDSYCRKKIKGIGTMWKHRVFCMYEIYENGDLSVT